MTFNAMRKSPSAANPRCSPVSALSGILFLLVCMPTMCGTMMNAVVFPVRSHPS